MQTDAYGQPLGDPVEDWRPRVDVGAVTLQGRWSRVAPLAEGHFGDLYAELVTGSPARVWTYLGAGPFEDRAGFEEYLAGLLATPGWSPHVLVPRDSGRAAGVACYLRCAPAAGSVEVGGLTFGATIQRTRVTTEAMYLMARHVFEDLGYRRYEWKCDALNAASRAAAERLGFVFEGVFRQALVYKGRNRDTAWFSITDAEWPRLRWGLEAWLDADNFDDAGRQRRSLQAVRAANIRDPGPR